MNFFTSPLGGFHLFLFIIDPFLSVICLPATCNLEYSIQLEIAVDSFFHLLCTSHLQPVHFPICSRCQTNQFQKRVIKRIGTVIPNVIGNFRNGHIRVDKKRLCLAKPQLCHILHRSASSLLLKHAGQMIRTYRYRMTDHFIGQLLCVVLRNIVFYPVTEL